MVVVIDLVGEISPTAPPLETIFSFLALASVGLAFSDVEREKEEVADLVAEDAVDVDPFLPNFL